MILESVLSDEEQSENQTILEVVLPLLTNDGCVEILKFEEDNWA
jgi:hypothetical protein